MGRHKNTSFSNLARNLNRAQKPGKINNEESQTNIEDRWSDIVGGRRWSMYRRTSNNIGNDALRKVRRKSHKENGPKSSIEKNPNSKTY